ncbi:MAG: hypothetical protein ACRC7O_10375, partial [Fimbriiglobus sp.]
MHVFPTVGRLVAAAVLAGTAGSASAQTWNSTTGNWGEAVNWNPGVIPNANTATAVITAEFFSAGAYTINLQGDGSPTYTVGELRFNPDPSPSTWTIQGPSTLTLSSTGSTRAGVSVNATATITANTSGNGFFKTGASTLTLTGTNTLTTGATITAGTVQVGNGGA